MNLFLSQVHHCRVDIGLLGVDAATSRDEVQYSTLEIANGVGEGGRLLTTVGYSVQIRFPPHQAGGEAMYSMFSVPVGVNFTLG